MTGILGPMSEKESNITVVARNRKARHDYEIVDQYEAGIELMGSEVKSIRAGKINLSDSYAMIERGQVMLRNFHISPYPMASGEPLDPYRTRRLLLHRKEIRKLFTKTEQQGYALIPLSVYFKGKVVKVELGLGVGRKKFDKRAVIAEKEAKRRMDRAIRRSK